MTISSKHWAIVQGWIPATGDEIVSLLNVSGQKAHVEITVYYSHRDPAAPREYYRIGRTNRGPAFESIPNSPLQRTENE